MGGGGGLASARINSVRERGIYSELRHETRFSRGENFSRLNSRYISTGYLICFSQQNNRHILARDRELNALWSAINGEKDKTARLAYVQL